MSFSKRLRHLLKNPPLLPEADKRLEHLVALSPLYQQLLDKYPHYWIWLEQPNPRNTPFSHAVLVHTWENTFIPKIEQGLLPLHALQQFRRKMSLRIAYREVNQLATLQNSFQELTLLADFCITMCLTFSFKKGGIHWNPTQTPSPTRFCILGLGKLGGQELNFCSDVDLIFVFSNTGECDTNDRLSAQEFFTYLCQTLCTLLQNRSEHGFLYNVDLRLRPEGKTGPLVRSYDSILNYYSTIGESWERLALIKARPIAGNLALGEELLEELNCFRYPRSPSPHLLQEIGGLKGLIERKVASQATIEDDIKSGSGGIREIEFFTQGLQLLHGGKNPFLQTRSTLEALKQLRRYELITPSEFTSLEQNYCFLRTVENRLQMQEERQTHSIPRDSTSIAHSLNLSEDLFRKKLTKVRKEVNRHYRSLFPPNKLEDERQEWLLFLTKPTAPPLIKEKLRNWFPHSPDVQNRLRSFIAGDRYRQITRQQVILFMDVVNAFDDLLPLLARPLRSLERVSHFAECYGGRTPFFKACTANPSLVQALSLLFDRSNFIYELLCKHPEIMQELLCTAPRRKKGISVLLSEMALLPEGENFLHYLWLYVKAEQVRIAMGNLLYGLSISEVETHLSALADATLRTMQAKIDPQLCLIALGRYGSEQLTFGSDLDLLILRAEQEERSASIKKAITLQKAFSFRLPEGPLFELDLRLRPYGIDGALVTTLPAYRTYHKKAAKTWEKQLLTRARFVCGNSSLENAFYQMREELLYQKAADRSALRSIWEMRLRIEKEKVPTSQPERSFKAAAGGLLDSEFLAQMIQMNWGYRYPSLRQTHTNRILQAAQTEDIIPSALAVPLLTHYEFLCTLMFYVRGINHQNTNRLPKGKALTSIAKWLHFKDVDSFWDFYRSTLASNRKKVEKILPLLLD